MFPKRKFREFCTKHNIVITDLYDQDDITILFKDTNIEHVTSNPIDDFIYVSFKRKEYNETNYLYKPFSKLYNEDWNVDDNIWHNYDSYGEMTVPLPLHLYTKKEYNRLFTIKNLSYKNTLTTTIPFNTMEELEHLYTVVYPKLHKDIKDFYNSESFQKTLQTYNNNIQTIKTLKKGTIELVNKSYKITTKKSVIEDEFAI